MVVSTINAKGKLPDSLPTFMQSHRGIDITEEDRACCADNIATNA